jgi:hypothetical protein
LSRRVLNAKRIDDRDLCSWSDTIGLRIRLALSIGEAHGQSPCSPPTVRAESGAMLLADRGLTLIDQSTCRRYGAWVNIPLKRNRTQHFVLAATYFAHAWHSMMGPSRENVACQKHPLRRALSDGKTS